MINLGLVGIGKMGKIYLDTVSKLDGVQIFAISSKTKKTLNEFSQKYYKTTNYKDLEKFDLDGVIIATPAPTHFEIASFFLRKKIAVLLEKPLATTYEDSLKLLKLQKTKKSPFLVDHTLLFHPVYREIKKKVKDIGKIESIDFTGHNDNIRKDTSLILDWGPHGISLLLDLLDKEPKELNIKNYKFKDKTIVKAVFGLVFDHNVRSTLDLSWVSKIKKRSLKITGEKGALIFDDMKDRKLIFRSKNDPKIDYLKYNDIQPLDTLVKEFIRAIKEKDASLKDLLFSSKVVKWAEKLNKLLQRQVKS